MSDDTLIQFRGAPQPSGGAAGEDPAALRAECPSCGQRFGTQGKFCPFCGDPLVTVSAHASELAAELSPGRVIGERYRIEKVLGSGGMGTVYEVTHTLLERRMALKVLRPELAGVDDLSARFLREARAAAAIEHPNVVRISDFGTLGSGQAYFVMELLAGMPLRSLVATGRVPADRVAVIARQVADGLSAAHRAGIVHRDLKPDNIQVDPKAGDFVKVLDFGLARVAGASRLTKQGIVFGTPQYMSPEQAAGENVDHRSDIYSLGIMMYEMLTGSVPFEADTYMGVLTKHLRWPPLPLHRFVDATLLGGLEPIVLRALSKAPEQRFSNMVELIDALDRRAASQVERRVFSLGARQRASRGSEPGEPAVPGLPRASSVGELSRLLLPAGLGAAVAALVVAGLLNGSPADGADANAAPSVASAARTAGASERGGPEASAQTAPSSAPPPAPASAPSAPATAASPPVIVVKPAVQSHEVSRSKRAEPPPSSAPAPSAEPKRKKRPISEIVDPWADE